MYYKSIVIQYWGELFREIKEPGMYFLNPCGIQISRISTKQESVDLPNVRVVDLKGNPIIVSGMVRYRVKNISNSL